jgi:hypothetical protein
MAKQPAVICDVNGTLSDCTNRAHLIADPDNRRWDEFFQLMGQDGTIDFVNRFLAAQPYEPFWCHVLLTTGAPDKYRPIMEKWLATNNVNYQKLFMRGSYDFVKGYVWKERLYREEIEPNYDVVAVLEDKEECCQMYRSFGLHCWLVAENVSPRREKPETQVSSRLTTRGNRRASYGRAPRAR